MRTIVASIAITAILTSTTLRADQGAAESEWSTGTNKRPWSISDSISFIYMHENYKDLVNLTSPIVKASDVVVESDDSERFFYITRSGDLANDCTKYTLNVYKSAEIMDWLRAGGKVVGDVPPPYRSHSVCTRTSDWTAPGIAMPKWSGDGTEIYFLAPSERIQSSSRQQIFRYNLAEGAASQVTEHETSIIDYIINGKSAIFRAVAAPEPENDPYPAAVLSHGGALANSDDDTPGSQFFLIHDKRSSTSIELRCELMPAGACLQLAAISGDGAYAALSVPTVGSGDSRRRIKIVDLVTGTVADEALSIDGILRISGFRWIDDERIAVSFIDRSHARKVAVLDRESLSILSIRIDGNASSASRERARSCLRFSIEEDANTSQRLVVACGPRSAVLASHDPNLKDVWISRQIPFEWKEKGVIVRGGLYLPQSFRRGCPVPLVVQPYFYRPNRFLPDGDNSSIDASQLLVARGIAVLKYDLAKSDPGSNNEVEKGRDRLDAAVAALVQAGYVDPNRVGVTGFSRSGFHTLYAITHPRSTRIAAAVRGDSFIGDLGSFLSYTYRSANRDPDYLVSSHDLAKIFWSDKEEWFRQDPIFNLDKLQTPLIETKHGGKKIHGPTEALLGALSALRRPFDYVYFPQGSHQLIRPRERAFMLSTVVDWMDFWLQGNERADPVVSAGETKTMLEERYNRWRRIRETWETQQAWEATGQPAGSSPPANFEPPAASDAVSRRCKESQ